jgi:hypothetical protein
MGFAPGEEDVYSESRNTRTVLVWSEDARSR